MLTTIMKWAAIAALLLIAFFGATSPMPTLLLRLVAGAGAILVSLEAFIVRKYFLTLAFVAIAVVFNPVVPFAFTRTAALWLDLGAVTMFAASLTLFRIKTPPLLSMPSITDRTPGSQSL